MNTFSLGATLYVMPDEKTKAYDKDTEEVSREQDDEVRNLPHIPSSEDTIALKSPAVQGEEAISGDTPGPQSDDMLENAHAVGEQPNEDIEHPKEIDIARDINKAQQEEKSS